MVDETQRQRAFTRPATGRNLADTFNRPSGGSIGPAGGPTTFRNTYPQSAQRVDDYMTRGMGPRGFNRQQSGPPANIGFDRMGIGSLQDQAAVDPSDWRVIQQILKGGGNPDDYVQTAMSPTEEMEKWERMQNYWDMPTDWEYNPEDLILDPFDENQLFGHTSKVALRPGDTNINDLTSGGPFYPENEGIMQVAGLTQTWQKIKDKLGESAANDWLASQQAV
tara:strand:+ start:18 stop:683 length:666 start_codon:yes stop_codon:yes gene_type:complete